MACSVVRIDTLNYNINTTQVVSKHIFDSSRGKAYFAWAGRESDSPGAGFSDRTVYFREFDVASEMFLLPPVLVKAEDGHSVTAVQLARLSDGTLILAYDRDQAETVVRRSTDNGAHWSAEILAQTPPTNYGFAYLWNAPNDDLYILTIHVVGGLSIHKARFYKSTDKGFSWGILAPNMFDFGGDVNAALDVETTKSNATRSAAMSPDSQSGCFVTTYTDPTRNVILRSWYTTNAWANWSTVDIRNWPASGGTRSQAVPNVQVYFTTTRVVIMWDEGSGIAGAGGQMQIAYSDNWGATWTIVGHPTDFDAINNWDALFDSTFCLDSAGRLYVLELGHEGGADTVSRIFRNNTPALSGWTQFPCNIGSINSKAAASVGDAVTVNADIYRVFTNQPGATGHFEYSLIIQKNVVPHKNPPLCIVTPLSSAIIQPGGSIELCGPISTDLVNDPWTYSWTGPGGFTAFTRCITVTVPGTYNLTVFNSDGTPSICSGVVIGVPAQPVGSLLPPLPFMRGNLPSEPSGHPSGVPSTKRVGW